MGIKLFPRGTNMEKCEDYAIEACENRTVHVIVVEIFDHPTSAYSKIFDNVTGPVMVGPADEVYAWLNVHDLSDYETQYEIPTFEETRQREME
jgi:hypothetical protein